MSLFANEYMGSRPIIPMNQPRYIKHPPRHAAIHIKQYPHSCTNFDLSLTAEPVNDTDNIGYRYTLTCSACHKQVGIMDLPHEFDRPAAINQFIHIISGNKEF